MEILKLIETYLIESSFNYFDVVRFELNKVQGVYYPI